MRCLYCGKPLPLLKKLTGGGEFCSDAHRHKYQEEYNKLALSRLLQAQAPAQPQQATSSGLTPRALRQLPPPAPRPGQRALPAPAPAPVATPLPPPLPAANPPAYQASTTQAQVAKPATGFTYRPAVEEPVPAMPDPPYGMFHIDRFNPLRRVTNPSVKKIDVVPDLSTAVATLPGPIEELGVIAFDWDAAFAACAVELPEETAGVEEIVVTDETSVEQETAPAQELAADDEIAAAVQGDPDPPEAPAWAHPIPFAEWPLTPPKLEIEEALVFTGLVLRPRMRAVDFAIRHPQAVAGKVATGEPQFGVLKSRWSPPFHFPATWTAAAAMDSKPSVLKAWQEWRPVFLPVTAPAAVRQGVPAALTVPRIPVEEKRMVRPEPPPAAVGHESVEVVIDLSALGLLDDPN